MSINEEELKAGVGQMLFNSATHSGPGCRGPWLPWSSRPISAFGQPATAGRSAEYPAMLGHTHRQLKPNAFVSREQRQVAVGGGRADDLQPASGFQGAVRANDVLPHPVKQLAQPDQSVLPVAHQRDKVTVAGLAEGGRRLIAGGDPLDEECLH